MQRSPSSPSFLATVDGRYKIRQKLGSGSLGTVYLADDRRMDRLVALKILRRDRRGGQASESFRDEFRAIVSLRHPRIASAYDFGHTGSANIPYYSREYVEGQPLSPGPPRGESPEAFLSPILDLLDALAYLHDNDVLHLDLHAGNLIVADDPSRGAVVIDFGLVNSCGPRLLSTRSSWTVLPPEFLKDGLATSAADIFLAGRLLHYRLTGSVNFEGRLAEELSGWGPRLTLDLERILTRALNDDPKHRFTDATHFRKTLERVLGSASGPVDPSHGDESRRVTIGRSRELSALEDLLRSTASGRPAVLGFRGPRGIGKTKLLDELRLRAQLRGLETVAVSFLDDVPEGSALLEALNSPGPDLGGLGALDPRHGGSPRERARRAAEAAFADAGRPVVLILDDLDRADADSRLLAQAIIEVGGQRSRLGLPGRGLGVVFAISESEAMLTAGPSEVLPRSLAPLSALESRELLKALLRPVEAPRSFLDRIVRSSERNPLRISRIARVLRDEWGPGACVLPATARLPDVDIGGDLERSLPPSSLAPEVAEVLQTLAVVDRPVREDELLAVIPGREASVRRSLGVLRKLDLVRTGADNPARTFRLEKPALDRLQSDLPARRRRRIHAQLVSHLKNSDTLLDREHVIHHLVALGQVARARSLSESVVEELRRRHRFERAVDLLEKLVRCSNSRAAQLELAEKISAILEETGDHARGVTLLEPFHDDWQEVPRRTALRLARRLGVHLHRAGYGDRAAEVFQEAIDLAQGQRDLEELILIDSELAELHTFRANYEEAEVACRRGLGRLGRIGRAGEFAATMEVMLRASLGHLELRRMNLKQARDEFRFALDLALRSSPTATQITILNNLGIVENQLNHLGAARRVYQRAERLLIASGEFRSQVKLSLNLAVLAAKTGDRAEAERQLERGIKVSRQCPGRDLEFAVSYTRATVAHILGDYERAMVTFEEVLPLGRELGDRHLVAHGEVYLAEAYLACGRYAQALKQLQETSKKADGPLLDRLVHSRIWLIEALLGRPRRAEGARRAFQAIGRTSIDALEAWNDLVAGIASWITESLRGNSHRSDFPLGRLEAARDSFRRMQAPAGERLACTALLAIAVKSGDRESIRHRLASLREAKDAGHTFLGVLEPLVQAGAFAALDDSEGTREALKRAGGSIVGSRFLELDYRLELQRLRLDVRDGNLVAARQHLHRNKHTRDLLLQLVPPAARQSFSRRIGFDALESAQDALVARQRECVIERSVPGETHFGMVGRSPAMLAVFAVIEELRAHEVPVLISGEPGTGKELVARALHEVSARASGAFMALHCGSLPEELFESELFGYEAGAFTGAEEAREGILERLAGGTLLLDGIGELAFGVQGKLLRVLESQTVRRLGSVESRPLDVRFLATDGADLSMDAPGRRIREDLYHRLAVFRIDLPPLRDREEDILPLAEHLLARHARRLGRAGLRLAGDVEARLRSHPWNGNARELENVLFRACIKLSHRDVIEAADLDLGVVRRSRDRLLDLLEGRDLKELREDLERAYLGRLFREVEGDLDEMMRQLGIGRTRLYTWLKNLGLDVRRMRDELDELEGRA